MCLGRETALAKLLQKSETHKEICRAFPLLLSIMSFPESPYTNFRLVFLWFVERAVLSVHGSSLWIYIYTHIYVFWQQRQCRKVFQVSVEIICYNEDNHGWDCLLLCHLRVMTIIKVPMVMVPDNI